MEKPLIKWNIGPVVTSGFYCLFESVKRMQKFYGNTFDYLICHNQLNKTKMKMLRGLNIPLFSRNKSYGYKKYYTPIWKLHPPRFRLRAHEISLDNDVIIYNRSKKIEEFLERDDLFIMSEAVERAFGNYDDDIPQNIKLNSGFYGLPPYFDFAKEVEKYYDKMTDTNWFDEQGLTAKIITNNNYKILTLEEIGVCYEDFNLGTIGAHFVGLNKGLDSYWKDYKKSHLTFL